MPAVAAVLVSKEQSGDIGAKEKDVIAFSDLQHTNVLYVRTYANSRAPTMKMEVIILHLHQDICEGDHG